MVEVTPDCSLKGEIDSVSWRGSKVAPLERTAEPRHGGMNGVVSPGPSTGQGMDGGVYRAGAERPRGRLRGTTSDRPRAPCKGVCT